MGYLRGRREWGRCEWGPWDDDADTDTHEHDSDADAAAFGGYER